MRHQIETRTGTLPRCHTAADTRVILRIVGGRAAVVTFSHVARLHRPGLVVAMDIDLHKRGRFVHRAFTVTREDGSFSVADLDGHADRQGHVMEAAGTDKV